MNRRPRTDRLAPHEMIAQVAGITSADVRYVERCYHMDAFEVTTWNRRRIIVSGLDIVRAANRR